MLIFNQCLGLFPSTELFLDRPCTEIGGLLRIQLVESCLLMLE